MSRSSCIRNALSLVVGLAVATIVPESAGASTGSFNVSTTLTATCTVTNSGPSNLYPTYSPVTDSGTGQATTLDTSCNGSSPTVSFSDTGGTGTSFLMTGTGGNLWFYLSNAASCIGTSADSPLSEGTAYSLGTGTSTYNICAAVQAGSFLNMGAPAGTYLDEVTYTISP